MAEPSSKAVLDSGQIFVSTMQQILNKALREFADTGDTDTCTGDVTLTHVLEKVQQASVDSTTKAISLPEKAFITIAFQDLCC